MIVQTFFGYDRRTFQTTTGLSERDRLLFSRPVRPQHHLYRRCVLAAVGVRRHRFAARLGVRTVGVALSLIGLVVAGTGWLAVGTTIGQLLLSKGPDPIAGFGSFQAVLLSILGTAVLLAGVATLVGDDQGGTVARLIADAEHEERVRSLFGSGVLVPVNPGYAARLRTVGRVVDDVATVNQLAVRAGMQPDLGLEQRARALATLTERHFDTECQHIYTALDTWAAVVDKNLVGEVDRAASLLDDFRRVHTDPVAG